MCTQRRQHPISTVRSHPSAEPRSSLFPPPPLHTRLHKILTRTVNEDSPQRVVPATDQSLIVHVCTNYTSLVTAGWSNSMAQPDVAMPPSASVERSDLSTLFVYETPWGGRSGNRKHSPAGSYIILILVICLGGRKRVSRWRHSSCQLEPDVFNI